MPKEVYAFESAQAFDRAARATRFVERIMKGPIDPRDNERFPQTDNTVYVKLVNPKDPESSQSSPTSKWTQPSSDGFYVAQMGTVNQVTRLWQGFVDDEGREILALVCGLNDEELEVPSVDGSGKIYLGRILGYYEDPDGGPPEEGDPDFEAFEGCPVVGIIAPGSGPASVDAALGFPAKITGYTSGAYSWQRQRLVVPNWVDDGDTVPVSGTGNAYPIFFATPDVYVGSTVWMWQDKVTPTKYGFIPMQYASVTLPGYVSTTFQEFKGEKTFYDPAHFRRMVEVNTGDPGNRSEYPFTVYGKTSPYGLTQTAFSLYTGDQFLNLGLEWTAYIQGATSIDGQSLDVVSRPLTAQPARSSIGRISLNGGYPAAGDRRAGGGIWTVRGGSPDVYEPVFASPLPTTSIIMTFEINDTSFYGPNQPSSTTGVYKVTKAPSSTTMGDWAWHGFLGGGKGRVYTEDRFGVIQDKHIAQPNTGMVYWGEDATISIPTGNGLFITMFFKGGLLVAHSTSPFAFNGAPQIVAGTSAQQIRQISGAFGGL